MTESQPPAPADSTTISQIEQILQRTLSQETPVSRFDRWVEFLSAIVLALATVATAWSGYQSALWGGDETKFRAQANTANIRAAQLSGQETQRRSFQASLFIEWAAAISEENQRLADFLYQRFPPELKTATDAWMATKPLQNPDAPSSPFVMPEYVLPETEQARQAQAETAAMTEKAENADAISDRYVLLTVIFASVLFFGGIAGKFQSRMIDAMMLGLSFVVFIGGLVVLLTYPIQ